MTPAGTASPCPASWRPVISGTLFNDLNGNGNKDSTDVGLANRKVWLDADKDGVLDSGEKTATTNAAGNYLFSGLTRGGSFRVRQAVPSGWRPTGPSTNYYDLALPERWLRGGEKLRQHAEGPHQRQRLR